MGKSRVNTGKVALKSKAGNRIESLRLVMSIERQGALAGVWGGNLPGLFERDAGGGHIDSFTVEDILDGQDLEAGVITVPAGRAVKAFFGGLGEHRFGRRFQRDVDADGRRFAGDHNTPPKDEG